MNTNFNSSLTRLSIKGFREIKEIPGAAPADRIVCVPVTGDSLKHLGILHGDILVTWLTDRYVEGQLCIWDTPHGRTAKFADDNFGTVLLHNRAEWAQTWERKEIKLLGVVVRVERDLEVLNAESEN